MFRKYAREFHIGSAYERAHLNMISCRRYILKYYSKQLSVPELVEQSCMTENAFIQKARPSNTTLLSETTAHSVAEICFSVGYADQNNFSKQFRAYFNQSPSDHRKQFQN